MLESACWYVPSLQAYPTKVPQLEQYPDDWVYYEKKCYYGSGAVADWNGSQNACSTYGASLTVIDSHKDLIRLGCTGKKKKFFWMNGELCDSNLFHVNITNDGDCVHIDSTFISTRRRSSLRNSLCIIGQFNTVSSS
ncbi:C-type lectin domain family 2 member L-like [Phaenicophaeus curvirostris]|uniref:C-type lectin domain family 2 member L-like n=1 Tax=Phaenicophaeus curvirostris TaxID=33595 RepID=UPI0037F0ECEE